MSLVGRFVGVDRHAHPDIPDLSAAARDATALWALFQDSYPSGDFRLVTDSHAPLRAVRDALVATLENAQRGDVVVLAYAGHGTRNHCLVCHDTDPGRIAETTMPMRDLADAFRRCRAKAILCILDCCFSGGAPARVLDASPQSRTAFDPSAAITGDGRAMIAASRASQEAFEHASRGHGLLTHALVEVLSGIQEPADLWAVMGQIIDRVEAEAIAIGCRQTPVAFNLTEGAFRIGPLIRGSRFAMHFPEHMGVRVGRDLAELEAFGIDPGVIDAWRERFPRGLIGLQLAAINDCRILDGRSALVVAPTSSGKTFLGEMAGIKAVGEGKKVVFLLPYRALVNEKYEDFLSLYGQRLGLRVIRCSGDYLDQTREFAMAKFDIAILTYEMFLSLILSRSGLLHRVGLIVLDEAQFIGDRERGIVVELILTRLRAGRQEGIDPQLLLLSATMGNINRLDTWLDVRTLVANDRPVPLVFGVLDRSGIFEFQDGDGQAGREQLLSGKLIVERGRHKRARDILVPLTQALLANPQTSEKILIFRNRRPTAERCAVYLAEELGLGAAGDAIDDLPTSDPSTSSANLLKALEGGVAFHTANLSREEREVVERAFRDPSSPVRVLVATTTVAAGVNTPASTVVIVENEFPRKEPQPFSIAEVQNMAGRAGRLGIREVGRAILLAENAIERRRLFARYVAATPEPVCSSFDPKDSETWVLRLLAQVKVMPASDVGSLLSNTYGGYVALLRDPAREGAIKKRARDVLREMLALGLVDREGANVRLSVLGEAVGRSSLKFGSAMGLVRSIRDLPDVPLSVLDLAVLLQVLPEMDGAYTPIARDARDLEWTRRVAARLRPEVARALRADTGDRAIVEARAKRVSILLAWIEGRPMEAIEAEHTMSSFKALGPGDVRAIADRTRFHFKSAYEICLVAEPAKAPDADAVQTFLKRLEVGIPETAVGILDAPVPITRGECLSALGAGIRKAEELLALAKAALTRIFGRRRSEVVEEIRRQGG